jgi:uncharacterized hydrophobic protein (TIGR00271 family)
MAMVHLRMVSPPALVDEVLAVLRDHVGVIAAARSHDSRDGSIVVADVARESANGVLVELHRLGLSDDGMVSLYPVPTALGALVERAEDEAPGEGDDAVIWDELREKLEDDSTLTWTFLAFMVLATILGAIGVITDSSVTVVGAMVVGPEFGPLAGIAIGLVRGQHEIARRAVVALVVGFVTAIAIVTLLSLVARGVGLLDPATLHGQRQTDFIYHPGWFSLITALVAGSAGMLSLISSRATALVGVFISVTTIPAAGNAAVAGAVGDWHEAWQSAAQLGINLVGISTAGALVLLAHRRTVPRTEPRIRSRGT